MSQQVPLFITIPHSGEKIPDSCYWLQNLEEPVLMCDIDRYVDRLYEPFLQNLSIPYVKTEWHRYAVDLNRIPTDVDASSVQGHPNPVGMYSRGYHWTVTTLGQKLLPQPLTQDHHQALTDLIYTPFHQAVQETAQKIRANGFKNIYHIDAHSMPSIGTAMHKDPGERRADIVVSDSLGKSCSTEFRDLVIASYVTAGFKVGYNWPYVGGRLTEEYGRPQSGHHTIQVELNRSLYMDEVTKKLNPHFSEVSARLQKAVSRIQTELGKWSR